MQAEAHSELNSGPRKQQESSNKMIDPDAEVRSLYKDLNTDFYKIQYFD